MQSKSASDAHHDEKNNLLQEVTVVQKHNARNAARIDVVAVPRDPLMYGSWLAFWLRDVPV